MLVVLTNRKIDTVKIICKKMDKKLGQTSGTSEKLIKLVKDRPGHDFRYAIDASKIKRELGWSATVNFEDGISKTIDWYFNNKKWLENVISGDYRNYNIKQQKSL